MSGLFNQVANELYKGHGLKSTSRYNSETDGWVPSISISWSEGESIHFHTFDGPPKSFVTVEDAVAYGLMLARLWVNKELQV